MTKKTFDLIIITLLLSKPAFGLAKMVSSRWASQETGVKQTAGEAGLLVF